MPGARQLVLKRAFAGAALVLGLHIAGPAAAQLVQEGLVPRSGLPQGSAVLTLDQDRLFVESAFGRALQARTTEANKALTDENLTIEKRLEQEERDLTARRPSLSVEEFAVLADAFDVKVEAIRQAQDIKSREITQKAEDDRKRFLSTVFPILGEMMTDAGAVAILPKSAVFMSLNVIDVTDEAIRRIDAVLGDGSEPPVAPGAPATP